MRFTVTLALILLTLQTHLLSQPEYEYVIDKVAGSETEEKIVRLLVEDIIAYPVLSIPTSKVKTIVAYAFGNRILPNGNRLPGPVNEKLADLVVVVQKQTGAHVYAQWEIAEAIGDRIPEEYVTAIYPTLDEQANVVYLSTYGVAQAIMNVANEKQADLGTVAVFGFHDHIRRCVKTSRSAGMDAYFPEGYDMPAQYDELSGQPWTRARLDYLEHELRGALRRLANVPRF